MKEKGTRFYVRHLKEDAPPRRGGYEFQIQIVDDVGQATAWVNLTKHDTAVEIDGVPVPTAVIEAARRLPVGTGDFVDESGHQVLPIDL